MERTLHCIAASYGTFDGSSALSVFDAKGFRQGKELTVKTRLGSLDIIGASLPVGSDRKRIVCSRQWWAIQGALMPVCTSQDILKIKESTGREVDRKHAALLRTVQKGGKGEIK